MQSGEQLSAPSYDDFRVKLAERDRVIAAVERELGAACTGDLAGDVAQCRRELDVARSAVRALLEGLGRDDRPRRAAIDEARALAASWSEVRRG